MTSASISRLASAIDAFEADAERLAEAQAQAVRILRCGLAPERASIDEVRRTRERANQGVPAAELHDAYRLCLRILGEPFVVIAAATRVAQAEVLAATRLLWESADILTSVVVGAREAADLDRSRHHQGQRGVFLRGLLHGSAGPLSIREHAAAFGLAGDRSYYAVRARAANATQRDELQTRLEASTRTYGCRPLLDLVDGDVAGIVPLKPTLSDPRFTIGIGGAHELGDLAIHVAVAAEPELGALLVERYLLPLHHEGDYGAELEDTIRVHLEAGARINETARRLQLHPNSVRHRLTRFEELTGARLDGLTVQFEIWWALAWLRHERRSARGAE